MSAQTIETILFRAINDVSFAEALLANPEQTLAGFDVTEEELANIKSMSYTDDDQFASVFPEERKSMGFNNHNETVLTV
jgi:hypothetical protein